MNMDLSVQVTNSFDFILFLVGYSSSVYILVPPFYAVQSSVCQLHLYSEQFQLRLTRMEHLYYYLGIYSACRKFLLFYHRN